MATTDEFAAACKDAARNLRRADKDVRRYISVNARGRVAVPLSDKIAAAATGPWAAVLAAGVKTRAAAEPTIVVGGLRPRLSGGAGPRQLVFGTEFGGGKRLSKVAKTARRRGHRRYSTNQFAHHHAPFVFPTIGRNVDWVLDEYADIVLEALYEEQAH